MPVLKATFKNIKKCALIIKKGGVVAFPTETVYGLGADAFNENAVLKIFNIKKRPRFDPLIIHIANKPDLFKLASHVPNKILRLTQKLWPGPLTIILPKKKIVPDIVTASMGTVAVRMPDNKIALELIKLSKKFIAAPSANKFSKLSPTSPSHILKQLGKDIPIIDGKKTVYGIESTIIKYEKGNYYLLRPGAIEKEKIEKIIGKKLKKPNKKIIEAPGQIKKHYSPDKKLIIVNGEKDIKKPEESAYISFYKKPSKNYLFSARLSKDGNLIEAASNLFEILHLAEESKAKQIYIQKVPEKGIGLAIMDRIRKASGNE
ncbi:MAG: threonylcarbamoyl-AMP synthase [Elusimicrobiota bacterium]